jgi:hypothetical protein
MMNSSMEIASANEDEDDIDEEYLSEEEDPLR